MEWDHDAISRKLRDTLVKAKIIYDTMPPKEILFYMTNMDAGPEGEAKVQGIVRTGLTFSTKSFFMSTKRYPTNLTPRLEVQYWNPDNGLYYTYDHGIVLVQRRLRRTFQVGLSSHSYYIRAYDSGTLGSDGILPYHVDASKPRVFQSDAIFTKNIFKRGSSLYYNNHRIGITENNRIYLNDSDYVHFLPEGIRESCIINH